MAYDRYNDQITSLSPVAVRLGQTEICAPEHSTWGLVTCDACGEKFAIGPNRVFGSRHDERGCVAELERKLADDHRAERHHPNHYEVLD